MFEIISHSPEATEKAGEIFARYLKVGDTVAMFGDMGMGKTVFARGLVKGLGSCDAVSSPTFAIVNEYSGKCPVYHFDMYRISSWDDLFTTGFFDYNDGIKIIEWSENIENALPECCYRLRFNTDGETGRKISIEVGETIDNTCS